MPLANAFRSSTTAAFAALGRDRFELRSARSCRPPPWLRPASAFLRASSASLAPASRQPHARRASAADRCSRSACSALRFSSAALRSASAALARCSASRSRFRPRLGCGLAACVALGLLGLCLGLRRLAFGFRRLGLLLGLERLGAALVFFALLRGCSFGGGGLGLLGGLRLAGAALVVLALLLRRQFGLAAFGQALRLLGGLARRLALGARLFLALLRRLGQEIEPLLGVDRQRRIRKALDESLQRRDVGRCPSACPTRSPPRRGVAASALAVRCGKRRKLATVRLLLR